MGDLPPDPLPTEDYSYLLGLYLGDGHLSAHPRDVYRLRVFCDERYPTLIGLCIDAMHAVMPGNRCGVQFDRGCATVWMYSKRWPQLFPQHGPGRKHERPIQLAASQRSIVNDETEAFVRGLINSDGCRSINQIRHGDRIYRYPRYSFSNASDDIRDLFTDACDRLGIEWRQMNARNVSVAKRASVARLDEFVGPRR